ncbi:ABC transporter substrate-binding protein [Alicyclobacillus mengziensis]|uniref:Sugar ABC transporter substrate-binding protein n=1 Tax=Alicyclobacillus mengziensis TaxID=2931921 RepID=A0A9X7W4A2_9BACL|nr:sugar ABC transporter substrate-binding protein [Alicyclobacillus mengziensis]QSO49283.1 sugar ABC transporter substrate-binding protein [Alicyclobacillus mengziensis]
MKRRMKRTAGVVFSAALLMGGVTACGSASTNSSNSGTSGGNSTSSGNGQKVTITFDMWGPVPQKYNFIKAFEKKYPNIHVALTEIPQTNYSQKINAEVASGTAPDVMLLWENQIQQFAKDGAVVNLDTYIKNDPSLQPSNFIPAFQQLAQQSGGTYGLPWVWATHLLYYNKTMFKKAGVPYPTANWTWQDYQNAAKKLTIVKNGKTVQWGSAPIGFPGVWYSLAGSAGDQIVKNGKLSIGQGAIKAMQWQNTLVNQLHVEPQPSTGNGSVDLFQAGKAAMEMNGSWMISTYDSITNFKWDVAPLPYDTTPFDGLHTAFFTINSKSSHKTADWDFIKFMMSPQGQKLLEEGQNNVSAEVSLANKTWYQNAGTNGPTNWAVFNQIAKYAKLGYVLLPAGLTTDGTNQFNAVLLGQKTPQQALQQIQQQASQVSGG